jgi:hypothetical protein
MSDTYADEAPVEDAPADEAGPFDDATDGPVEAPAPVEAEEGTPADPDAEGTPVEPEAEDKPRTRAAPTDLQGDMKRITDLFVQGDADLTARLDGKPMTPSRVAAEVQLLRGSEKAPSTGAVAAAFKRWEDYGFATFNPKPFSFADYTDEGRAIGLKGILANRKAARTASEPTEAPAEDG